MNMWITVAIVVVLLVGIGALWVQKNKKPAPPGGSVGAPVLPPKQQVSVAAPACKNGQCLAVPTSANGQPLKDCKGCHHDLCCDSLCPSLSQFYNPMTKSCMERPLMPYGYNLASGPCITDFQWCSANPPEVPKGFPSGLPAEEAQPCDKLCDRFGGTLYYTGFSGAAAQKPAFVPSTYDGFQSYMGSEYASDHYVSSATS